MNEIISKKGAATPFRRCIRWAWSCNSSGIFQWASSCPESKPQTNRPNRQSTCSRPTTQFLKNDLKKKKLVSFFLKTKISVQNSHWSITWTSYFQLWRHVVAQHAEHQQERSYAGQLIFKNYWKLFTNIQILYTNSNFLYKFKFLTNIQFFYKYSHFLQIFKFFINYKFVYKF